MLSRGLFGIATNTLGVFFCVKGSYFVSDIWICCLYVADLTLMYIEIYGGQPKQLSPMMFENKHFGSFIKPCQKGIRSHGVVD